MKCLPAAFVFLLLTAASGASAQSSRDDRARALFEAGRAAIDEGDYAGAHRYFSEAYDVSKRPQLLFNIANSAERLRRDDEALQLYRRFLEEVPDAANRAYVEGRIRALEAVQPKPAGTAEPAEATSEGNAATGEAKEAEQTGQGAPGEAMAEAEPVAAPSPANDTEMGAADATTGGSDITGWIIAGAGAAVAVAGVVVLVVGLGKRGSVDDAPVGSDWQNYAGDHDLANTLIPVGSVMLGVGLAAGAVGVVMALGDGQGRDQRSDLALRLGPSELTLMGSF
ncbi:MAG: hypothetical protein OEZ06_13060 [Myxococcales bacterium]|nr:hypothetical protein [Myxococcales bacterium]